MATISFDTTFNLTTASPEVSFLDTTDWAGQGIATSDVRGVFKIVAPSGITVYNNTDYTNSGCDIQTNVSLVSQQTIPLPLGGDGLVEAGNYVITYSVYDSNLLTYSTKVNTYTYEYVTPEICISQTVDCISPLFTSTDITEYDVEGITPTKTITHTIYYPNGSSGAGSPLVAATAVLATGVFYNGVQTSEIESSLTYVFSDGLIVLDQISGSKDIKVDCTFICSIYCCIRALEQQVMAAKGVNDKVYNVLSNTFQQVMAFAALAKLAIECGKSDDVNCYLNEIKDLANCTDDCSCSGDEPDRVSGLGGLITSTVVQSGGVPIIVTPVVVGNVTTYTVSLSSSFVNTVNSLYNTELLPGTYIYSIPNSTAGLTKTFTINAEGVTVTNGDNISITTTVTNETTDYLVATDMITDQQWDVTVDNITGSPTSFVLPAISVTIPSNGKYQLAFDATAVPATGGIFEYAFYVNSTLALYGNKTAGVVTLNPLTEIHYINLSLNIIETLLAGDVIEILLTSAAIPDVSIIDKSMKLIKLS